MKLPHTEVKFYPEVKSQTRLSSLRVSCKRALIDFASRVNVLLRRTLSIFKVHSAYCRVPHPPIAWSNGAC